MKCASADPDWPTTLFGLLRDSGIALFPFVPDAGNSKLIELADEHPETQAILLTTEEEGVAFCAGADLVGRRAALVLQSSGVGNCTNFFGLVRGARFPVFMIVSMRGEHGETNPWQYPMGQAVVPVLDSMGILPFFVRDPGDLEMATQAALSAVFKAGQGAALVFSQRFLGAKSV